VERREGKGQDRVRKDKRKGTLRVAKVALIRFYHFIGKGYSRVVGS
jgi:hypothetical protein